MADSIEISKKKKIDQSKSRSKLGRSEIIRRIVDSFSKQELVEIVKSATVRDTTLLGEVRVIADRDTKRKKLYVQGLGGQMTNDDLTNVFFSYGELEEGVVIKDKKTNISKGYGFVTFQHLDSATLALEEPSKKIGGIMTVTRLANDRVSSGTTPKNPIPDENCQRVYVSGVPNDIKPNMLLEHFLLYGEVEEGPVDYDKETGKSRGYALFVYKNLVFKKAPLVDPIKNIDGSVVRCSYAFSRVTSTLPPISKSHDVSSPYSRSPPIPNSPNSPYTGYPSSPNSPYAVYPGSPVSPCGGYRPRCSSAPLGLDYGSVCPPASPGISGQLHHHSPPAPDIRAPCGALYQNISPYSRY